ncbi:MAG: Rrf2 family transcriptional regulator [Paracoccaceae bacterium]|nr:Rrf2 family transcriptional regulator [Paracoccaceae bacterium]|tara:strand:+ start:592 stop:1050 length:459 start_codon:yes stop_codon:yes gene_type:complete
MQLGKFTDFGLRVMLHLAVVHPQKLSVQKIATTFNLSDHHLAKVCSTLVKAGLIRSERGRNGGLRLSKPPEDTNLGEITRVLTQNTALVECDSVGDCSCLILPVCSLYQPLKKAQNAFFEELDKTSLALACGKNSGLHKLLSLSEQNHTSRP